ncbi:MAG: threonine ammonia-lyase, biosynthetic [Gammaproteobacteria bacterium]|nr:threonine ammonia-lyase, biosynthetic [Gammaproteobacteria bacterium]
MFDEYKPLIDEASERVYEVARRTELDFAPQLSEQLQNRIWLKREDRQAVFSYKIRGAYNMMASLSQEQGSSGVIAASAGNHAQGVALAAQKLGIAATIVMPKTTPEIKVSSVRRLNARVILHGNNYDDAKEHALELAEQEKKVYVPPYDHPLIISGQATVAVELLEQHQGPDLVFVPVGGGGLISGMALHIKRIKPDIKIIAVEPDEAACLHAAMGAGERIELEHIGIFADGAAVKQIGEENYRICRDLIDDVLLVSVDEICAAVKDIFEDTRAIPEPAGALALAGLKQYVAREKIRDCELVAVFSGANVNFDRLRHIAELSALGEHREALLCITVPEHPGTFRKLCHDLGPRPITEFNYRYADSSKAHVFVGIRLRHGMQEKQDLLQSLAEKNYAVLDMSDDEVAKMHIRHMVGGIAENVADELLYRFEFPERAGALLYFLTTMSDRWNISLFHYRNHGAAYGRVLLGVQVPESEREEFKLFLTKLNMVYSEESDNRAYQMYLSAKN